MKMKILDLGDQGMAEVGTWTNTNRLFLNQMAVQQMSIIGKHLQVVTREVIDIDIFFTIFSSHFLSFKERPYVIRNVHPNGTVYFEGYCS